MKANEKMNKKGFTLVELAIVLIIIGILLGMVLKGQDLIQNARIKRLENDMKGFQALQFTFNDRYNRFAGDGDKNGAIDFNRVDATLEDFDNNPQAQLITTETVDIDAPFSDLEYAQLLPIGDHREIAKHVFNNAMYFASINGYNMIVIKQIPCFAAKTIDKDIDLVIDAKRGYIREAHNATTLLDDIGNERWEDICPTENTLVDIVYFFDKRPD